MPLTGMRVWGWGLPGARLRPLRLAEHLRVSAPRREVGWPHSPGRQVEDDLNGELRVARGEAWWAQGSCDGGAARQTCGGVERGPLGIVRPSLVSCSSLATGSGQCATACSHPVHGKPRPAGSPCRPARSALDLPPLLLTFILVFPFATRAGPWASTPNCGEHAGASRCLGGGPVTRVTAETPCPVRRAEHSGARGDASRGGDALFPSMPPTEPDHYRACEEDRGERGPGHLHPPPAPSPTWWSQCSGRG